MKLISVIVPVFNVPSVFLKKCIESIMNQSYKNLEIILVDDGSTTDSGDICDFYGAKDIRIKVYHKKNGGLSSARNYGFLKSTGDYITFVDGDDYLDADFCDTLYKLIICNNADLAMCDVRSECANSFFENFAFETDKLFNESNCIELQNLVLTFGGKVAQVFAKLISRNFLVTNDLFHDEDCKQGAEGLVFCYKLFQYTKRVYYHKECLYHYQYNFDSISHKLSNENIIYTLKCFNRIKYYMNNYNKNDIQKELFYTRMLHVILTCNVSGFFNPFNNYKYTDRRKMSIEFLNKDIVKSSLLLGNKRDLSIPKKIALFCLEHKLFFLLNIIAIIRCKTIKFK